MHYDKLKVQPGSKQRFFAQNKTKRYQVLFFIENSNKINETRALKLDIFMF